jgi:hypothetical protein
VRERRKKEREGEREKNVPPLHCTVQGQMPAEEHAGIDPKTEE